MIRRLAWAGLAVAIAAAPARGQQPERVPADTVPTGEIPADATAAEPDTTPALPGVRIDTLDEEETQEGFPWVVAWPGWFGVVIDRYNRVDGLVPGGGIDLEPVEPGEVPEIGARVTLATTHDRLYWRAWLRQRVPAPWVLHAEVEYMQRAATFDEWKYSGLENSLATFLAGRDRLDWWRERGWRLSLETESSRGRFGGGLAFLAVEQRSQRNRDPFVLFGDGSFRPVPEVAEGDLRSLTLDARLDTRDVQSPMLPAPGWWIRGEIERAGGVLGGDLEFTRALLDARRYLRFGRDTWWDTRLVALAGDAGGFSDPDLPPQRLARLGGPGSLRGFDEGRFVDDDALQLSSALRLPLPVTDPIALFFLSWHAVGFVDAATVGDWESWHADVGAGISGVNIFSFLGVFVAQRITDLDEDDAGPRFVVRLRRGL
ncbi:MAG: BamA/TamA family outer membrane protein [Gemmatimonadota bacterium]|nr:BamA/TamA family outer membrane protein [Gemmatimonadota bacterium]